MFCTNNYFITFTRMETTNKYKLSAYFKNIFYKKIKPIKENEKNQKFWFIRC